MTQSKGTTQPVEAPASHPFHDRLLEAITNYQSEVDHATLSGELLDAYQTVVTSNEYNDHAIAKLFYVIKETLVFNADLMRIVNHFSHSQKAVS